MNVTVDAASLRLAIGTATQVGLFSLGGFIALYRERSDSRTSSGHSPAETGLRGPRGQASRI